MCSPGTSHEKTSGRYDRAARTLEHLGAAYARQRRMGVIYVDPVKLAYHCSR